MAMEQEDLFGAPEPVAPNMPEGFRYAAKVLSVEQEQELVDDIRPLPFKEFEFHGYLGKRRIVSYGWKYNYETRTLSPSREIPDFLLKVRDIAARFAEMPAEDLQQILVTEYSAGAAIGWHRDKGEFGQIVGISLVSPCVFRLRRKDGATWERASIIAEPRSAYLMSGPSRSVWEHSIPPVDALRYSITLRNLRD
ncbi:MAG TPA: alpha-ketoglutarate-dependent dioxygenase AlkB [Gemmatimonadaceae bacterium]|jgi:alkylated DNA repair dioxygenase AlkB